MKTRYRSAAPDRTAGERFMACRECGKRGFWRKKDAKRFRRQLDPRMDVYRCRYEAGWHVGHLPAGIKRGVYSRSDLANVGVNREWR